MRERLLNRYLLALAGLSCLTACASDALLPQSNAVEGPHRLTIRFSGQIPEDVPIMVALYNHEADWLRPNRSLKSRLALSTDTGAALLTFYGLPKGRYAVAAFQDLNGNSRLDRWLGLLPREPVAFSVVDHWRRPPAFHSAGVDVPKVDSIEVTF